MRAERCKYCHCFEGSPREQSAYALKPGFGECRIDPPGDSGWPRVHESDWCARGFLKRKDEDDGQPKQGCGVSSTG